MKNNEELQTDVENAIKWEPLLHAAEIGVTAEDGIVTLSGVVDSYSKKYEAENAAKNVAGVKAVVEEIKVAFYSNLNERTDKEIAYEIVNALKNSWLIADDNINVKVEGGWVTLHGKIGWNYQKEMMKTLVGKQPGVKGVLDNIKIDSETDAVIEKRDIENALRRNWSINADHVQVAVEGSKVTLSGTVDAWYQRNEAERIAWNAPGVKTVNNNLVVELILQ